MREMLTMGAGKVDNEGWKCTPTKIFTKLANVTDLFMRCGKLASNKAKYESNKLTNDAPSSYAVVVK